MLLSFLIWIGLFGVLAGLIAMLKRSWRKRGAFIVLAGLAMIFIGLTWPVREQRATARASQLDEVMPVWQFNERHVMQIDAPPARVYDSVRAVTAGEIRLFRTLTNIRRFGCSGPESILNAPERKPILDVATQTTFVLVVDEPPREVVVATLVGAPKGYKRQKVEPDAFRRAWPPGFTVATMNFQIAPDGRGGSILSTETRVFANHPAAARRFARYWRVILPGSDIIRRQWLRAIRLRAEDARTRA